MKNEGVIHVIIAAGLALCVGFLIVSTIAPAYHRVAAALAQATAPART